MTHPETTADDADSSSPQRPTTAADDGLTVTPVAPDSSRPRQSPGSGPTSEEADPGERPHVIDLRTPAEPTLTRRSARARERAKHAGPPPETAESLTADRLLRRPAPSPEKGWRRAVFRASGGSIRPGESNEVLQRRGLEARVARRLRGPARFVPVLTRKGGTGKTTVTTLLGMTMATLRDDRVIAVDANPDRGTLAERVPGRTPHTVRHVVQQADQIETFAAMSELVTRDASRLDILASDTDPATAEAFGEEDYRTVAGVVARHYSIVLTDCGTGMVHSVMRGTLDLADELVLVSGASVDEARLASETLTWLEARGYGHLVRSAVVALNTATPSASQLDVKELRKHFESRCRVVTQIPYDTHLAEGAEITLGRLEPATRDAALELAANVVDGLGEGRD
ncbi:MAG TPA: MinD/ParA family protein [Actinomycetales bacterium]|nr:MinD/ParA family protein [Actinomycetales bacterium]